MNNNSESSNSAGVASPGGSGRLFDKLKYKASKGAAKTGLVAFKMKSQGQISMLEHELKTRKQRFGVDYLSLMLEKEGTSKQTLKSTLDMAVKECQEILDKIYDNIAAIPGSVLPSRLSNIAPPPVET